MKKKKTLDQLTVGQKAKIIAIQNEETIRRRLLDLGFVPGALLEVYIMSPFKDPVAYKIKNTIIALRKVDSKKIIVEECYEEKNCISRKS